MANYMIETLTTTTTTRRVLVDVAPVPTPATVVKPVARPALTAALAKGDVIDFKGDAWAGPGALKGGKYKLMAFTDKFGTRRWLLVGLKGHATQGMEGWRSATVLS